MSSSSSSSSDSGSGSESNSSGEINGSVAPPAPSFDSIPSLPFKWLENNKSPNLQDQLQKYLEDWQAYGILIKERPCEEKELQAGHKVEVYLPQKRTAKDKKGAAFDFYVPFKVDTATDANANPATQLPIICNTYAPLKFYHKGDTNRSEFPVRDNMCAELYALVQKKDDRDEKRKIRLAVTHLRRQNPVVCDLLLICAVSVTIEVRVKGGTTVKYKPYSEILEFAKAFAKGKPVTTVENSKYYVEYNNCRYTAKRKFKNLFKCAVLSKEAVSIMSTSIARHKGFWFYPGQSHFASFGQIGQGNIEADEDGMDEAETKAFRAALPKYFNPPTAGISDWKRPTATVGAKAVPVIDKNLWFVLKELNRFHAQKTKVRDEAREFSNQERLRAVTKYIQPDFKAQEPKSYRHETRRTTIRAAVQAYNDTQQNDADKHDVQKDVETFVTFQAFAVFHFVLCPGADVTTPERFFDEVLGPSKVSVEERKTRLMKKLNTLWEGVNNIRAGNLGQKWKTTIEKMLAAMAAIRGKTSSVTFPMLTRL